MVEGLFLAVSWGCLRFLIVVFPDHTHLLFSVVLAGRYIGKRITQECNYGCVIDLFSYFSTKHMLRVLKRTVSVRRCFTETVHLSTQNIFLNSWVRKSCELRACSQNEYFAATFVAIL